MKDNAESEESMNAEIVTAFSEDELHDFNQIISHVLIPKLIKFADDYNFDRDSIIVFTAKFLMTMSKMASFEYLESEQAESEGKE